MEKNIAFLLSIIPLLFLPYSFATTLLCPSHRQFIFSCPSNSALCFLKCAEIARSLYLHYSYEEMLYLLHISATVRFL